MRRPRALSLALSRALSLALLLAGGLSGQQGESGQRPQQPAPRLTQSFTAPDGSRFVLVRDPTRREIHWSVATWVDGRDDPIDLPGLTMVAMRTSLNGTWTIGSADPDAERKALTELDAAWQEQLIDPNSTRGATRVVQLDEKAAKLGDIRTYRRLLAAAPADRPRIERRGPVSVLTMTTIDSGISEVARLLVERRERLALRRLSREWEPDLRLRAQRAATSPQRHLHGEALALLLPDAPLRTQLEPPPFRVPTRAQAMASWQASQHPTRTVHVLLGDLELAQAKTILEQRFVSTALPTPQPLRQLAHKPPKAQRRSVVTGMPGQSTTIAWVLPPLSEPWAIKAGVHWLANELQRRMLQTRGGFSVKGEAPWPRTTNGRSLMRLDIVDPSGKPEMLKELLKLCRDLASEDRPNSAFNSANRAIQRSWNETTGDPRKLAAVIAEHALIWPEMAPMAQAPRPQQSARILAVLQSTFANLPAIVQGRR